MGKEQNSDFRWVIKEGKMESRKTSQITRYQRECYRIYRNLSMENKSRSILVNVGQKKKKMKNSLHKSKKI